MFVRPNAGLMIRRHDTLALLPAGGEDVPDTDWCHRRLRDGDVLEGPAKAEPEAAPALVPGPVPPHDGDAPAL